MKTTVLVRDLPTPALVIDATLLEKNLATMAAVRPGVSLRPHVKAHKCTTLARAQRALGHTAFCGATPRELIGMARAGLGDDLLLANQSVDLDRLRALASLDARVTVAIDSEATIDAAATAGLREVLVDVNVGMPRCGCAPDDAARIADLARSRGLAVRGVMGYEGHAVGLADRAKRTGLASASMDLLRQAHEAVGGDVISAGGTGTFDMSALPTEIQAGSYALMDTAYAALDIPFANALRVVATVISTSPGRPSGRESTAAVGVPRTRTPEETSGGGYAVADCGLKALGMDHGNPTVDAGAVWFCSDEHVTFAVEHGAIAVGDRVLVTPAHVDPTVAYHETFRVADGAGIDAVVVDEWPIDLRGW